MSTRAEILLQGLVEDTKKCVDCKAEFSTDKKLMKLCPKCCKKPEYQSYTSFEQSHGKKKGESKVAEAGQVIVDYELEDQGFQNSDYHQGFGTSYTDYEHSVLGAGSNPQEALRDAFDQIHNSFSPEMQEKADQDEKEFDAHKVEAGISVHISFVTLDNEVLDIEDVSVDYAVIKDGKVTPLEVDVTDSSVTVTYEGYSLEAYEVVDLLEDSGLKFPESISKKLQRELDNSENDYYYYIGIRYNLG